MSDKTEHISHANEMLHAAREMTGQELRAIERRAALADELAREMLDALEFHGEMNQCGGKTASKDDCMWCVDVRRLLAKYKETSE